jgi:hypothetical protein
MFKSIFGCGRQTYSRNALPGASNALIAQDQRRLRALRSTTGSAPIARATVMNSMISRRRSPPSYLATKDCGRRSRLARSCRSEQLAVLAWDDDRQTAELRVPAAAAQTRIVSAGEFRPSQRE